MGRFIQIGVSRVSRELEVAAETSARLFQIDDLGLTIIANVSNPATSSALRFMNTSDQILTVEGLPHTASPGSINPHESLFLNFNVNSESSWDINCRIYIQDSISQYRVSIHIENAPGGLNMARFRGVYELV